MPQSTGKRLKKIGFMSVGDIDYHGVPYTIWVGSDPSLAQGSWEKQKAQYFPDYVGPPPPGLPGGAPDKQITKSTDLFK
jgi:hypothetical protein